MLTDAQMTDVRRFAGYPLSGTTMPVTSNTDIVYMHYGMVYMSLYTRLTTFSASEETVLGVYLTNLTALEMAVVGAGDNLDTDAAAVWTHNKNEVRDRSNLFDDQRRRMCQFIGLKPGPALSSGTSLSRC
jgi:hypothetical protein